MELIFIVIDSPKPKEYFLQHIKRLIHIDLDKGDTYNDLFDKLRGRFDENSDEGKAVWDWIYFNREQVEDASQWNTIIADEEGLAAHFDIRQN